MNMFNAWERRDTLDEKTARLLLQNLQYGLEGYRKSSRNYPPERMEKFGKPYIEQLEYRILTIRDLITSKFE